MAFQRITEKYVESKRGDLKSKYQIGYTLIFHKIRKKLGITIAEYCVAEIIYHLGGGIRSREIGGWCYASKETIADNLGFNKKTITRAVKRLLELKLLEKNPETRHLRITAKWYAEVVRLKENVARKA